MSDQTPTTLARLPFVAAERFGEAPAQGTKHDGRWEQRSYVELGAIVDLLARGLISLGVRAGDRVALVCETREEWMQAAYAIVAAGATIVPIYATNSVEECDWVLRDSGAVMVICEDASQRAKIEEVRATLPDLQHVMTIEPGGDTRSLADLADLGRGRDDAERIRRTDAVTAQDRAIIIYTSGTTGRPKGCVLTHGNLMACAEQATELDMVGPGDIAYLFLPLAHVYAQTTNIAAHVLGLCVYYVSEGPAAILPDLAEVRPTYFPSVPRIYEKVYSAFSEAPRTEETYARVRELFGGRIACAITGAAPIAREILEFFHAAGVPIYEGYGLSETTSYGSVNTPAETKLGTVGKAMPFGEIRIADDGEILLRGPHVFAGYWNNDEATAEAMTEDGWFASGDLGSLDEEGYLSITGRKKEIIVTAGGKNIAPGELENELRQCPFVSHVVMHGDRRPYPVALVTLDAEYVLPWAEEHGHPSDLTQLAYLPTVRQSIQAALDEANSRHARVAQVKKFAILGQDFSQETGELTATLKMKRSVILDRHGATIEALYAE